MRDKNINFTHFSHQPQSVLSCLTLSLLFPDSFEKLKKQAATFSSPDVDCPANIPFRYSHLSPDSDFMYTDFSKRGEKSSVPTLKSQVSEE